MLYEVITQTTPGTFAFGQALSDPSALGSISVAEADLDGDGDLDLYFASNGANRLLLNDGSGNFGDASVPPLDASANTRCAAVGDVDNDGDLDLYLSNVVV